MASSRPTRERPPEHFSPGLFVLTVITTVAVWGAALRFLAPGTWRLQWQAPAWGFAAAFAAISLLNCFFEFFFHRYVLHRPAIRGLGRFYRQHTLHHALTRIVRKPSRDGRELLFVENKYPIIEPDQGEGSFFPWYALAVFIGLLSPVFALLQWLVPTVPWFLGGIAALASSMILYEGLHAINHWPLQRWTRLMDHPRWGSAWRRAYSFHLRHHAVIDCNESVSGFFGLPLADWAFRTCVIPPTIYADGEAWLPENFTAPRPRGFIRWLDRSAARALAARRAQAAGLPAVAAARTYSRGEVIANWLTHGVGAALSVAGLTILIVFASLRGDAWRVISFTVFGLSMLVLYVASTLHHLSRSDRRRWLFRRLGHAAIFLLIAGTYTPFLLANLQNARGWSLFGIIWGLCGAGAVFRFTAGPHGRVASVVTYLFAGWLIVGAIEPLWSSVPHVALWLLLAGSLCYTMGVPFYLWRRLRYHQAFWHGFVLGGSACHFFALLFLLGPARP
jgi:hemolysin III